MRSLGWMSASVFAAIAVVGVAAPAQAAPAYPKADGRCVDQTAVLGQDVCAKVTAILLRDEKSTSDEIAVAVVATTGESGIEAWSTGLFNTWGVGKKSKNNGVLLVVAIDDREVRLETGRGAANRLSDSDAVTIVDDVTAHFAEEEYALGILTGLDEVRSQLGHTVPANALLAPLAAEAQEPAEPDLTSADESDIPSDWSEFTSPDDFASADDSTVPVLPIALGGVAVVVLLAVAVSRGSSRRTGRGPSSLTHHGSTQRAVWTPGTAGSTNTGSSPSSHSAGSSDSSFGGGSSDGGGATGSW